MSDLNPEMVRGIGVAGALALALAGQAFSPHARLRGSWRTGDETFQVGYSSRGMEKVSSGGRFHLDMTMFVLSETFSPGDQPELDTAAAAEPVYAAAVI